MHSGDSREPNVWKGVVAGAAAGLVAAWAMTEFQQAWSKVTEEIERERQGEQVHSPERGTGEQEQGDDATMKAADRLFRAVLNRNLSKEEKKMAGPFVHYTFGSLTGALYGAMAERSSLVTAGQGTAYGTAVFVFGDEIAVSALGLSGPITESPLSSHIYAWASHLVYGLTLERVRKGVRALMSDEGAERMVHAIRETAAGVKASKTA